MVKRHGSNGELSSGGDRQVGLPLLLFAVLGPPVSWAAHFAVIYFVVAVTCAAGVAGVLLPVAVATLITGGVCAAAGVAAFRRWAQRSADERLRLSEIGSTGASYQLLMIGILGAAFFTLLILLEALPPLFLPQCPPGGS